MDGRSFALMGPPDRPTRTFGGVANDVRWAGEQAQRVVDEGPEYIPIVLPLVAYFGLVDLPLSLVGDIVTLPKVALDEPGPASSAADTPNHSPAPERAGGK
jgi:hypothetical protein